MPSRQEQRSEETRRAILAAAGELFSERGFDVVTMREIAKAAQCSHTTIYIYFKDKEALLHELVVGPLHHLHTQMESVLGDPALSPDQRFRQVSLAFVRFCLRHRAMYDTFFMAQATRVDELQPELAVNWLRNQLFGLLRRAVQDLDPTLSAERTLAYARIHFFALHGIIGTYRGAAEGYDLLMERLGPTFELTFDVILAGLKQTAQQGADR